MMLGAYFMRTFCKKTKAPAKEKEQELTITLV
jgi:hypothetical protein